MSSLEERIGYHFRSGNLLALALTHPSTGQAQSNQRLEFLGDAVLGAIVTRVLYDAYPDEPEGKLASRRAGLVCGEALTAVAREIGLNEAIIAGSSEQCDNPSNLEDALEALIGAIYLDGGMAAAEAFVAPRWGELTSRIAAPPKDAKTALQEWAQGRGLPVPSYRIVESTGPAHAPTFTMEVTVHGQPPARAMASSKKQAEQLAAAELLGSLHD